MDWSVFFENLLSWPAFLLLAVGLGFLGLERRLKKIEKQNAAIMKGLKLSDNHNIEKTNL